MKALFASFVLAITAAGCSRQPAGSQPEARTPRAHVLQEFGDWCAAWGLTCPATAENVPSKGEPWSVAQWQDLMQATRGLATSQIDVRVTQSEILDPNLERVASLLGFESLIESVKTRLGQAGFSSLHLTGTGLHVDATAASSLSAGSGLQVAHGSSIDLSVDDHLMVRTQGLSLTGSHGGRQSVQAFEFTDPNLMAMHSDDAEIDDMPIAFALAEILGMPAASSGTGLSYEKILPVLVPLRDWLTAGQRDVTLDAAAFQSLAAHVPQLIADDQAKTNLKAVLGHLDGLTSTASTRGTYLVSVHASASFRCQVGRKAAIMFDQNFGLAGVEAVADGVVRIHLRGVSARPTSGLIRPTIDLNTLDLEADAITIHDIPILGTFTISMDEDNPLSCS